MHYVSADSALGFLSDDFSSVLIVMQIVAVRLCFVDDAIRCVYVETKSRLCLEVNDAVVSPPCRSQHSQPLSTKLRTMSLLCNSCWKRKRLLW